MRREQPFIDVRMLARNRPLTVTYLVRPEQFGSRCRRRHTITSAATLGLNKAARTKTQRSRSFLRIIRISKDFPDLVA
jgi:hypothetical protein